MHGGLTSSWTDDPSDSAVGGVVVELFRDSRCTSDSVKKLAFSLFKKEFLKHSSGYVFLLYSARVKYRKHKAQAPLMANVI